MIWITPKGPHTGDPDVMNLSPQDILALTLFGTGLVLILTSIPLILQKIPMNGWYGIRIAVAFESDEKWYAINAYGGKRMVGLGLVICLTSIPFWPPNPMPPAWYLPLTAAIPVVYLVPLLVAMARYGKSL